jgi:hypothetical protein
MERQSRSGLRKAMGVGVGLGVAAVATYIVDSAARECGADNFLIATLDVLSFTGLYALGVRTIKSMYDSIDKREQLGNQIREIYKTKQRLPGMMTDTKTLL